MFGLGLHEKSRAHVATRIRALGKSYGLEVEPDRPVHTLSVGERQRVEIVRALLTEPKLLILDEPTSVLTPQAVSDLFVTLRRLAKDGCSILYISHKLDEIRALCDTCTVPARGQSDGRGQKSRKREQCQPFAADDRRRTAAARTPSLRSRPSPTRGQRADARQAERVRHGPRAHYVQRAQRRNLGLAGVSGNGQAELLAALSGENSHDGRGSLSLLGTDVTHVGAGATTQTRATLRTRRATWPSHRAQPLTFQQCALDAQSGAASKLPAARKAAAPLGQAFDRALLGEGSRAERCSAQSVGGNLQKYVVGREIDAAPRVLVVAQPTWAWTWARPRKSALKS